MLHKLVVMCNDLSMLNVMLPNVMLYKCHVCCHFRLGLQVLEFHFFCNVFKLLKFSTRFTKMLIANIPLNFGV